MLCLENPPVATKTVKTIQKSYAGVFYVGVLKAPASAGAAGAAVATHILAVSTRSTVHRAAAGAATSLEVRLGAEVYPTSAKDNNTHIEVFDTHFVSDESDTAALVKKAQAVFDDPDGYAEAHPGQVDPGYLQHLKKFKERVSHCVVSLMGITTP